MTLLVNAEVTRLETDASGRTVTGVVVSRDGDTEVYAGDIVVVSAGASNSAKLLLRSANDQHPNGLANGSDQVGRNYMFHNCKAIVALAKEPNDTVFQKTVGLNDFYFGAPDYDWPVGNIQMIGKSNAEAMKGEEPKLTKLAPHFSLAEVARHALDFWLTTEDLPKPDNRVTVDGDGNIHLAYTSTNDDEADRLYHELKKLLNHVGLAQHHVLDKNFYMHMDISVAGVAHQAGTCRFGTDPATSVLDADCKAHELDNLYVVDTSFFPSIGAVNPALTAMANAIRVGEHLTARSQLNRLAVPHPRTITRQGATHDTRPARSPSSPVATAASARRSCSPSPRPAPTSSSTTSPTSRPPRTSRSRSPRSGDQAIGVDADVSKVDDLQRLIDSRRRRPSAGSTSWSTTPASRRARRSSTPPKRSTRR